MHMSQFEQDPSASTGHFRAFVERRDEDAPARRSSVSPVVWIIAAVVVIAIVLVILGLA
jgi:hypothetical protein